MSFVQVTDDIFLDPEAVMMIKAIDKEKCLVFLNGQSALEGHIIEREALDLATELIEEMNDSDEKSDDEEDDEDE